MNAASRRVQPAYRPNANAKTAVVDSPMSDRRTEKRWDVCLDAVWDGKSGNYQARVTDLSEGGCYVDSLGEAKVGEVIAFKLQLPEGEWLALTGEVAHQTPPLGFGLRFINLTHEQHEKLHSLFDQQLSPQEAQK
jgi:hypothetical protein